MTHPFDISMILSHSPDPTINQTMSKYELMNKIVAILEEFKRYGIHLRAPFNSEGIVSENSEFFYLPLTDILYEDGEFDFTLIIYDLLRKIRQEIHNSSYEIMDRAEILQAIFN